MIKYVFQGIKLFVKLLLICVIATLTFFNCFSGNVLADDISNLSEDSQAGYFSCSKGSNISGENGFSTDKLSFLVNNTIMSEGTINSLPKLSGCPQDEVLDFHLNISELYNIHNQNQLRDGVNIAPTINLALKTAKEARLKINNYLSKSQKQHSYIHIPQGNFIIETPAEKLDNLGLHRGNLNKKITRTNNKSYNILAHIVFLEDDTSIIGYNPNVSSETPTTEFPENQPTPLVKVTLKDSLSQDAFALMQFIVATPPTNTSKKWHNLNIKNVEFILPKALSTTQTVVNGAILLQDVDKGEISRVKIVSPTQDVYGQGIHLLGVENISLNSLDIARRSSGVSVFYATNLKIENSSFRSFNEAIDIDKGGYDIEIVNNFFGSGSRNSNETIDSNGTDGLIITGNKFQNNGRVLFFNGKVDIASTWDEWVNNMYPNDDENKGVFIGGKNLTFSSNTIISSYTNDNQRSLIAIGNNWRGNPHPNVASVVNANFSNNIYDSSGGFIIQECLGCNFNNETHRNAVGKFLINGFSEASADGADSSLILTLKSVNYETAVDNTLFENILSLRNIGTVKIENSNFKTHDRISAPLCRMQFDSFRKDSIYNNPSSAIRVIFDNVHIYSSENSDDCIFTPEIIK